MQEVRDEAAEVVQEGPREEEIVESDTEEEEILEEEEEERDAAPLRIRIPGARAQSGPPAAPEKEIVKMFVSGLKPEIFREEIST